MTDIPNANMRYDLAVKAWARRFLDVDPAGVLFGGREWVEADDRTKVAACVRAALAWYDSSDPHRLAVEVEAELEAFRLADEGDYAGWRRIARRVRALAGEPSHAELNRRRGVVGRTATTDLELTSTTDNGTTDMPLGRRSA